MNEILLSNTSEVDAEEPEITPYNPEPSYYAQDDEDDLLQPVEDFHEKRSIQPMELSEEMRPVRGQRLGNFVCRYCNKSFRYIKAFNTHIKQHKKGEISRGGHKRRYILKKKKLAIEMNTFAAEEAEEEEEEEEAPVDDPQMEEDQPPYDSLSPYGSPAHFEPPVRDDSPDLSMMMLNNFHNGNNGDNGNIEPVKKLRMRKQRIQLSASPDIDFKIEMPAKRPAPAPSTSGSVSRGRGRPRKDQIVKPKPDVVELGVEEPSPFANFCEVDVSRMLKKSIFDNDSFSQSAASTTQSRSRSASVELIDDVDIFGSVLPDNGRGAMKMKAKIGAGTTFGCNEPGCTRKFHLRVNLKKHLREAHGSI